MNPRTRRFTVLSFVEAFTLVELMVSLAILALIVAVAAQITSSTSSLWRRTVAKSEQFRAAREGFEAMTRRMAEATLNTYWDYDDNKNPTKYLRQSELRFVSGPMAAIATPPPAPRSWPTHGAFFFAPTGLSSDPGSRLPSCLNVCGYFVEFNTDKSYRPAFLNAGSFTAERYRFRLIEMCVPTQAINIYNYTSGDTTNRNLGYTQRDWFSNYLPGAAGNADGAAGASSATQPTRVLSENVVALVILPRLTPEDERAYNYTNASLSPSFTYDSTATTADPRLNPKNQLPPVLQVVMIAIDEVSAGRLTPAGAAAPTAPDLHGSLFQDASKLGAASGATGDLESFEQTLTNKKLNWRTYSASIGIRAARWSAQQAN